MSSENLRRQLNWFGENAEDLFLGPEFFHDLDYVPRLYFETRIDFADVRSGLQRTYSLNSAVEIHAADGDDLWSEDMVLPVDPSRIRSGIPPRARLRQVPDLGDPELLSVIETKFFQYLMRHFKVRVYRNFALNLYSDPATSLEEFMDRCLGMMSESFRRDLNALREVFDRRLEQIREKQVEEQKRDKFVRGEIASQFQNNMHLTSERIAEIFLHTEFTLEKGSKTPLPRYARRPLLEQRFQSVMIEAAQAISRLLDAYQEKVRNIDEYIVHPKLKDIHLVRSCILWMPVTQQP